MLLSLLSSLRIFGLPTVDDINPDGLFLIMDNAGFRSSTVELLSAAPEAEVAGCVPHDIILALK